MSIDLNVLFVGDDVNTDDIIPANRCTSTEPENLRYYAFEHVIGSGNLNQYDIIEAGHNFGSGSSREHAALAIKFAGIKKVRALSFAEIFYRNSINIGLPLEIIGNSETDPVINEIISAGGLIPFNQNRKEQLRHLPKSSTSARPMTIVEKLLARASGNLHVKPGQTIFATIDLAMSHDAVVGSIAKAFYQHFGSDARLWDSKRVVLVADHFIQVNDLRNDLNSNKLYEQMKLFAQQQNCHFFDIVTPGNATGICHVLLPEQGFIQPGMVIAGTDSHTCTYGAFGCFATGVGTTDMANIFATGAMWIRVPPTILFELEGNLPPHLCAKDIILFILRQIGCNGAIGKVIEFRGSIIEHLGLDERMTLCNMAIECGAICGIIVPDALTNQYVRERTLSDEVTHEQVSDYDAEYDSSYYFDLSNLEPQVACPPKPDKVVGISELSEVVITQAYIGSCTGGKLFDLAQAAKVLQGQKIHPKVSLFVVPASQEVRRQAETLGYLKIFISAGAQVLKTGCGACINAGLGVLGENEVGISTINRNFKGRSGHPTAKSYLASPRVVAISAVNGKISSRST
jgi:homoaconitate hydratase family protein